MKTFIALVLAAGALFGAPAAQAQCSSAAPQAACENLDPDRLAAVLTGEQEPGGGASNAWGDAVFLVDRDGRRLYYRVNAGTLSDITGAHVHRGAFGSPGPVVIDLMTNGQTFREGVLEGSVAVSGALLEEVAANPSAFFVNVHTTQFPAGAIRGQVNGRGSILMAGQLTMSTSGATRGTPSSDVASNATGVFSLGFVDDDPDGGDVRVDFDVMTDSIDGMDTTSLVLIDGDLAEDILDLTSVEGLVDGRLHGTARLSRDELARLLDNPSGYHLQFRSPNDGLFSGSLGEAVTTFIPAFARTRNAYGNQFSSDLRLYNPGHRPANVFIQFFPAGATSALAGRAALIRLEPGQARVIPDAVHTLFAQTAAMGSLRIVTSAQVVAESEIVDGSSAARTQSDSHNARFGQFVSGLHGCDAVTQGLLTSLSASQAANGLRTNVLIGNAGVRRAYARFELRDSQGRLLDSRNMRLEPHAQLLLPLNGANGLFRNAGSSLSNVLVRMVADTPIFLGASLIQNDTGEARFTSARDIAPPFEPRQ